MLLLNSPKPRLLNLLLLLYFKPPDLELAGQLLLDFVFRIHCCLTHLILPWLLLAALAAFDIRMID
jgi:hypothetical protein